MKRCAVVLMLLILITGCGADFGVSSYDLTEYAATADGVVEETLGGYSMDVEGAHVEFTNMVTRDDAAVWFENQYDSLHEESSSSAGSKMTESGDYWFVIDGEYHRILFDEEQCVYAYGEKDAVVEALKGIRVIK